MVTQLSQIVLTVACRAELGLIFAAPSDRQMGTGATPRASDMKEDTMYLDIQWYIIFASGKQGNKRDIVLLYISPSEPGLIRLFPHTNAPEETFFDISRLHLL